MKRVHYFSHWWGIMCHHWINTSIRYTDNPDEVTCKLCLNQMPDSIQQIPVATITITRTWTKASTNG